MRWLSLAAAFTLIANAQTVESLARNYAQHPTPAGREALVQFAAAHPKDESGAIALLALGSADLASKRFDAAVQPLFQASQRLPSIADHAAFLGAQASFELRRDQDVLQLLESVWNETPKSPLLGRAVMLAARSFIRLNDANSAIGILKRHYDDLPQPAGDLAYGTAVEASGDLIAAVPRYERVYYEFPTAPEAPNAATAIARLKTTLGSRYPAPPPTLVLSRASKLIDGGRAAEAKRELQAVLPQFTGIELDSARVRIGAADYGAREFRAALAWLRNLDIQTPDLDAERLYYVLQAARRIDSTADVDAALAALSVKHTLSRWRLQALIMAGNYYSLSNRADAYTPIFQTCYESFPNEPEAAWCHWKIAFTKYIRREPSASALLRDHLRLYPKSDKAPAALYFLARDAEAAGRTGEARAFLEEIERYYPNEYYAVLARERLTQSAVRGAAPEGNTAGFLRSISFPPRVRRANFSPDAEAKRRIERARLLSAAAADWSAETELRFGATKSGEPQVYALELARSASRRSAPDVGIRYIKAHAPGYLFYPLDAAPNEFWELAFPLPWRDAVFRYSQANGLDPYMVAALIRQESEFNPKVVSKANAYGLTQILPATGRDLSRRLLKTRRFRAESLFDPETNIQLGTFFLKRLLDSFDGRWEPALASYNAGRTRPAVWVGWAEYREPAEFVESIPISETRNYVQLIVRNAAIYRALYQSPAGLK